MASTAGGIDNGAQPAPRANRGRAATTSPVKNLVDCSTIPTDDGAGDGNPNSSRKRALSSAQDDGYGSPIADRDLSLSPNNAGDNASASSGTLPIEEQENMHIVNSPSKRYRSSNWPLGERENDAQGSLRHQSAATPPTPPPRSARRRNASVPSRASRFQEASMHDRTSDKPPSTFLRIFKTTESSSRGGGMEVDQLMEDYMAEEAETGEHQIGKAATIAMGMNMGQRSASRSTTNVSIANATMTDSHMRTPGMFRLSKTFASALNPVNLWQKMSKSWADPKEEVAKKEPEVPKNDPFEARRLAYEAKYQELKKAGLLGQLGSNTISGSHVFSEGYTRPAGARSAEPGVRYDSACEMTDSTRPSVESNNISSHSLASSSGTQASGTVRARTISFFRTPSLSNLRKSKSTATLRPPKTPTAEETSEEDGQHALRRSQSKKDLAKQQRLTKRVSNLEAKLEEARRELKEALGEDTRPTVPPVPALPKDLAHFGSVRGSNASIRSQRKSHSRNVSKMTFSPELPSLPSERLLDPDMLKEASRNISSVDETSENAAEAVQRSVEARNSMIEAQGDPTTPVKNGRRLSGQLTPEEKILASTELVDVPMMPDLNAPRPSQDRGDDENRMSFESSSTAAPPPPPAGILKKPSTDGKATPKKRKSAIKKTDRSSKVSGSASDGEEYTSKSKPGDAVTPRKRRLSRLMGLGGSSEAEGLPPRPHSLYDVGRNNSTVDIAFTGLEVKTMQGLEILDEDTPFDPTTAVAPEVPAPPSSPVRSQHTRHRSGRITVPVGKPSPGPLQFPDEGGIILKATSGYVPRSPRNKLKKEPPNRGPRESFEWPDDVF